MTQLGQRAFNVSTAQELPDLATWHHGRPHRHMQGHTVLSPWNRLALRGYAGGVTGSVCGSPFAPSDTSGGNGGWFTPIR